MASLLPAAPRRAEAISRTASTSSSSSSKESSRGSPNRSQIRQFLLQVRRENHRFRRCPSSSGPDVACNMFLMLIVRLSSGGSPTPRPPPTNSPWSSTSNAQTPASRRALRCQIEDRSSTWLPPSSPACTTSSRRVSATVHQSSTSQLIQCWALAQVSFPASVLYPAPPAA
nr:uncharacterized protein LOC127295742 [Lolium perenne]XP_051181695.1 uncharacterized protein LOC127295742 [Lolium perenne]